MKQLLSTLLLSCSLTCIGAQEINIIPKPIQITQAEGKFVLTPQTLITYDKELELQASYLQEIFGGSTGWDLQMEEGNAQTGAIHLSLNPEMRQAEGYELEVTPSGVQISGADPGGVFYGIQTLLQLFPAEVYNVIRITTATSKSAATEPIAHHSQRCRERRSCPITDLISSAEAFRMIAINSRSAATSRMA